VTLFLIIVAAVILWAGSLYLWPFAPCTRCKGSGRNAGSNRQRFGSRAVHRSVRGGVDYRRRKR